MSNQITINTDNLYSKDAKLWMWLLYHIISKKYKEIPSDYDIGVGVDFAFEYLYKDVKCLWSIYQIWETAVENTEVPDICLEMMIRAEIKLPRLTDMKTANIVENMKELVKLCEGLFYVTFEVINFDYEDDDSFELETIHPFDLDDNYGGLFGAKISFYDHYFEHLDDILLRDHTLIVYLYLDSEVAQNRTSLDVETLNNRSLELVSDYFESNMKIYTARAYELIQKFKSLLNIPSLLSE